MDLPAGDVCSVQQVPWCREGAGQHCFILPWQLARHSGWYWFETWSNLMEFEMSKLTRAGAYAFEQEFLNVPFEIWNMIRLGHTLHFGSGKAGHWYQSLFVHELQFQGCPGPVFNDLVCFALSCTLPAKYISIDQTWCLIDSAVFIIRWVCIYIPMCDMRLTKSTTAFVFETCPQLFCQLFLHSFDKVSLLLSKS